MFQTYVDQIRESFPKNDVLFQLIQYEGFIDRNQRELLAHTIKEADFTLDIGVIQSPPISGSVFIKDPFSSVLDRNCSIEVAKHRIPFQWRQTVTLASKRPSTNSILAP
jgi:hypothetical protein